MVAEGCSAILGIPDVCSRMSEPSHSTVCSSGVENPALQPGAPAEREAGAADHADHGQAGGYVGGHRETGT